MYVYVYVYGCVASLCLPMFEVEVDYLPSEEVARTLGLADD